VDKGFLGSVFDLSFRSFVTIRLVKILYILTLILLGLAYIGIAVAIFSGGGDEAATFNTETGTIETSDDDGGNAVLGVLWLILFGPLLMFFYVLLYRVFFELIVVVFRIYENTRDQLAAVRGVAPAPAPPPPSSSPPPPGTPPTAGSEPPPAS
jgi:uncharacterized membrane protein YccF (DUF307 family)